MPYGTYDMTRTKGLAYKPANFVSVSAIHGIV